MVYHTELAYPEEMEYVEQCMIYCMNDPQEKCGLIVYYGSIHECHFANYNETGGTVVPSRSNYLIYRNSSNTYFHST